jgi:hypothetical protein
MEKDEARIQYKKNLDSGFDNLDSGYEVLG